ncbi:MAG: hypothetical protein AAFX87_24975 [Bacteroidota bacterium]
MANETPLINGESVSWAQLTVNVLNTPIVGITSVSYEDMQEIVDNYGKGNYPVSRGFGKVETKASLTLLAEEADGLVQRAPKGRLQEIPEFDMVVTYLPVGSVGTPISHVVRNCRFKGNKRDIKQGDTKVEVQYEICASHIEWTSKEV